MKVESLLGLDTWEGVAFWQPKNLQQRIFIILARKTNPLWKPISELNSKLDKPFGAYYQRPLGRILRITGYMILREKEVSE